MSAPNHHATAVAIAGRGVLLRGPSGSGKSSLAVSLLRRARGTGLEAALVADDQVALAVAADGVRMAPFPATAGMIELRGIGILRLPFAPEARLALVVDLVERAELERLPEPASAHFEAVAVPRIAVAARDPAFAADLVLTVLEHLAGGVR